MSAAGRGSKGKVEVASPGKRTRCSSKGKVKMDVKKWKVRLAVRKRYWVFLMGTLEKKKRFPLSKVAFVFGALCRARGKVCPFHNLKHESL